MNAFQSETDTEPYATLVLPDGRALGYLQVGLPDGPAVFHFHGHGSSRLEALMLEEQALALGLRVIALDRPGIGRSDPRKGDRLLTGPQTSQPPQTTLASTHSRCRACRRAAPTPSLAPTSFRKG